MSEQSADDADQIRDASSTLEQRRAGLEYHLSIAQQRGDTQRVAELASELAQMTADRDE